MSQWADRFRVLDESANDPGQWKTDKTPYLRGIMDAFNDLRVEEIIMCMPTQVGKTESMLNMLAYCIDQDPGTAMWVDSTEPEATELCQERIISMVEKTPFLAKHMTGNSDDVTKRGIKLDRMKLKIAWATSPATLASRSIRYLFMNETNKYPAFSGREADPIKLARERTRTFDNRKIVQCSTPTTREGYITREYDKTDKRKYFVPCPCCNHFQILVWSQIKVPSDARDPEVIRNENLAYYECIKCKNKIVDSMKPRMLMQGRWVPEGWDPNDISGTHFPVFSKVGFWLNALYSPWLTFSEIAGEWFSSYQSPELLMNFVNSWLAEPFNEHMGQNKESEIRSLAREYEPNVVPQDAMVLFGVVDVQKDYFHVNLRAWGIQGKSWGILHTVVENWAQAENVLFKSVYSREDGKVDFPVQLVLIDSGDGSRTGEVYEFCAKWREVARPIKGRASLNSGPVRPTMIERYPTGQPIPGGISLWNLDTTFLKDKLSRLIRNAVNGQGVWFIHRNPANDYIKQMCSEHKAIIYDKRTRRSREEWQKVAGHLANHAWDCEVYQVAAAEMMRVFYWQPEPEQKAQQRSDEETKAAGGWIPLKPAWINRR